MPDHTTPTTRTGKPTRRQMAYLKDLAAQRGQTFSYPATAAEASREIDRLRGTRRTPTADVARERRQVADDMASGRGDAARVRDQEITGYGSGARWANAREDRR
jgi:hypothetical protein